MILAGGQARRLGGADKPALTIGAATILDMILNALDMPDIAISANGDPGRFARFGCPVLADGVFENQGPLAGVLAGLDWAASRGAEALLTIPGDTPFIPRGLAAALSPAPACAASGGRVHHLVALWPADARHRLREHLARPGFRHAGRFGAAIGMRQVDFPAGACPPGECDAFMNVNTPADLERARGMVWGGRPGNTASGEQA